MSTTLHSFPFSVASKIKVRTTASGIHLFHRTTGTNVLLNEIQPSPSQFALAPRQVSIALTNACDLACEYCYAPKTALSLPLEKLMPWLRELDQNGTLGVGFGGGEPTLYPKLHTLCEFMIAETNLAVTLTTHAHRFTKELADKLHGNIHFIRVSMDGIGTTYETNRGRRFNKLIERIRQIRDVAPFGINYVVNSSTISELNEAVDLATTLTASEFLLLPERPTPRRPGIDDRTRKSLNTWVRTYKGSIPLTISVNDANGLPTCNPLPNESALEAFAHIDASGTLKRTSYDTSGVNICKLGVVSALGTLKYHQQISS